MIEGDLENLLADVEYLEDKRYDDLTCYHIISRPFNHYNYDPKLPLEIDLQKATDEMLNVECSYYLGESEIPDEKAVALNDKLAKYVLDNTIRSSDGRLIMPLMWNDECQHLLGKNLNLAKKILNSNRKKFSKDAEKLILTDQVFKEQLSLGIIQKVENFPESAQTDGCYSFLPHMSVYRPDHDSTKTRVVFLSNLCEIDPELPYTVCHNQAIRSGPNLNSKLLIAILMLKFDRYVLTYDLVKAFLMIQMTETDQKKLMMLWFKDVKNGNFDLVYYKSNRLPFGIPCAPSLLMLALFKILIVDFDSNLDPELNLYTRKLLYSLLYMDNGALTSDNLNDLKSCQKKLENVYGQYKFNLQQFVTNSVDFQAELDEKCGSDTDCKVKLFGMEWDRVEDTFQPKKVYLDKEANTRRLILKTYAENFDPLGYSLPILNRAKVFIHQLQCDRSLSWDDPISSDLFKEWKLICRQVDSTRDLKVDRGVGSRSESFKLVAFTDASKQFYGTVIYLQSISTKKVSLLMAKNKIVNKQLETKSIPSLELCAVVLGVDTLKELHANLCGDSNLSPITIDRIELFCDSMISLNWIDICTNKLAKSENKLSVFVRNRILKLQELCKNMPVTFSFISGHLNPADLVTRIVSYKQLSNSCYFLGPDLLQTDPCVPNVFSVTVPCPEYSEQNVAVATVSPEGPVNHVIPVGRYSSFSKLVRVTRLVYVFVSKLKREQVKSVNLYSRARSDIIRADQQQFFPDCVSYLLNPGSGKKIPNLVKQLNLYLDTNGIVRVRGKFDRNYVREVKAPILLSKHSKLSDLIIDEMHSVMNHSGKYAILAELRRQFYVPSFFSKVKSVLNRCTLCRRLNARPLTLSQSPYREERVMPNEFPFRDIYMDHFGPFEVSIGGKKQKVYLLLLTCMFTRAFNIQICLDMTVKSFLRAFQMHIHKYGMPAKITSDSGSTLLAGGNLMMDFLKGEEATSYLKSCNIPQVTFDSYCKGKSALGGLVESGVKIAKKLIFGFKRRRCLDYCDFEFLISDVNHLINKRPVAFLETARDDSLDDVPEAITPEMLLFGHSLPSINVIPGLQPIPDDPDYAPNQIRDTYAKLRKVRESILEDYRNEYVANLLKQSIDRPNRYVPKTHVQLRVGDIVTLKERFVKPANYPLAIVRKTKINVLGEVTSVIVKRGDTKEVVERHVESVVPLLQLSEEHTPQTPVDDESGTSELKTSCSTGETPRPKRKAARMARKRMAKMIE